ncbi:M28 family metallopeptidase [Flavobacteriales bacterium]|nr:M28 family metallopeptidase [Flavobacteriales bacterium]
MKKLLLILLCAPLVGFSQLENDGTKYSKTISIEDLEKHLKILASDSLEGRETGQKGQKMAADYIMNHFKNIGIPPYKGKTYYQKFKVKNSRHMCKCDDCDVDFLKKILGKNKYIKGENVLGFIEGTDLKEEIIIITAHYDHLGKHEEKIYNGADDDGSGTVAALEIAEAFMLAKKEGHGPRRSVLIMPVSGEEKGLLGSEFYTDNPIYPLENTVANLNIDMIGRIDDWHENGDYVYLIGADMLSQELHDISEQVNKQYIGLDLDYTFNAEDDPNRYYYRSDHYNFAKNNIPVIFYFNGVHEDYHKVTDTVEKIDFNKIQTITRLVFLTAWELANRNERIQLNKKN